MTDMNEGTKYTYDIYTHSKLVEAYEAVKVAIEDNQRREMDFFNLLSVLRRDSQI